MKARFKRVGSFHLINHLQSCFEVFTLTDILNHFQESQLSVDDRNPFIVHYRLADIKSLIFVACK